MDKFDNIRLTRHGLDSIITIVETERRSILRKFSYTDMNEEPIKDMLELYKEIYNKVSSMRVKVFGCE